MKNFLAQSPIPNSVTDAKNRAGGGFRYPAIRRTLVHAKRAGDCQDKRANEPIAAHIADGAPLTSTLCNGVAAKADDVPTLRRASAARAAERVNIVTLRSIIFFFIRRPYRLKARICGSAPIGDKAVRMIPGERRAREMPTINLRHA
jgi:hypothetical protein